MTRAGRFWELLATPFVWLFVGTLAGWELLVRTYWRFRSRSEEFACVGCGREGYIACPDCPYEVIAEALGWEEPKRGDS